MGPKWGDSGLRVRLPLLTKIHNSEIADFCEELFDKEQKRITDADINDADPTRINEWREGNMEFTLLELPAIVWSAKDFFGSLTMSAAIAMVFLGLPAQIKKNRREKKCGQPFLLAFFGLLVYMSRIGYAITIRADYLILPDIAGAGMAAVILFQFFKYDFA